MADLRYLHIIVPQGTDEKYKETIEGMIYATFPDAEIKETNDYTAWFNPQHNNFAGCELILKERDVYPIKTYERFEEDSMSRLFSVISKIESGEQVWVQIIVEPHPDSALYHFLRNIRYKLAALKKFFSIRDRLKIGRASCRERG